MRWHLIFKQRCEVLCAFHLQTQAIITSRKELNQGTLGELATQVFLGSNKRTDRCGRGRNLLLGLGCFSTRQPALTTGLSLAWRVRSRRGLQYNASIQRGSREMTPFVISYAVIKFLIGNLTIDWQSKISNSIPYFPLESKNNYVRNIAVNVYCLLGTAQEWKSYVACIK